jgi:hypothetical protein
LPLASLTEAQGETLESIVETAASRRRGACLEVVRDRQGEIAEVRIGRWRMLAPGPQRRIAEVHELADRRVAVRIERFADSGARPTSEIWQLYDAEGRLDAALQTSADGRFGLLTNYRTREACRLSRNAGGELEAVEQWRL